MMALGCCSYSKATCPLPAYGPSCGKQTLCSVCHGIYDYDYDYIMAPQRGRPYGANLGSMGRNTGTWSIRSESKYALIPDNKKLARQVYSTGGTGRYSGELESTGSAFSTDSTKGTQGLRQGRISMLQMHTRVNKPNGSTTNVTQRQAPNLSPCTF